MERMGFSTTINKLSSMIYKKNPKTQTHNPTIWLIISLNRMYIRENEGPNLVSWDTLVFISRHVNTLVFQINPWFSANQCNRESLILALFNLTIRLLCSTDVTKHSSNFFTQIKSLTNWDYLSAMLYSCTFYNFFLGTCLKLPNETCRWLDVPREVYWCFYTVFKNCAFVKKKPINQMLSL